MKLYSSAFQAVVIAVMEVITGLVSYWIIYSNIYWSSLPPRVSSNNKLYVVEPHNYRWLYNIEDRTVWLYSSAKFKILSTEDYTSVLIWCWWVDAVTNKYAAPHEPQTKSASSKYHYGMRTTPLSLESWLITIPDSPKRCGFHVGCNSQPTTLQRHC